MVKITSSKLNASSVVVHYSNGDVHVINIRGFLLGDTKVSSRLKGQIKITDDEIKIVNNYLSKITGIPKFTRNRYKTIMRDIRGLIKVYGREFYSAKDCINYVFGELDLDSTKFGSLLSQEDYLKLQELATKSRINAEDFDS